MWSKRRFYGFITASSLVLLVLYVLWEPTAILDGKNISDSTGNLWSDRGQFEQRHPKVTDQDSHQTDHKIKLSTISTQSDYDQLTCKFPRPDPLDPSILEYVSHPRTIDCKRVQDYDMTYMDNEGYIRVNESEWDRAMERFNNSFQCIANTLDRSLGFTNDDNEIIYGPSERLERDYPLRMTNDAVSVECKREEKEKEEKFYENIHAHPTSSGKRDFQDLNKAPEDQLNVHLIILDSVSKSVMRRHLPSTYEYLSKEMGFYTFEGYNKVGDNTRPNLIPVMTGKRIQYEQEDMPCEFEDPSGFLDNGPELIWKSFRRLGYAVTFNEDCPRGSIFTYGSKGYHHKPADYYYHSMWWAILRMSKRLDSSDYCFGNYPMAHFQFDLTERHMKINKHKLQFTQTISCETTHDIEVDVERGDDLFASFFRNIDTPELTNRSVMIFMGDHGHRMGPIRKTLIGLIEERQPMFNIRFPPWFYKKYPHIRENLRTNTMRLTSPFDVHETLKDIANRNFKGSQRPWGTRGLSFLYPIPKNRTCTQAGIPDHFCTCTTDEKFEITNQFAISAGKYLTDYLNNITSNSSSWIRDGLKCLPWVYKNVTRSERVGISSKAKAFVIIKEEHDPKKISTSQLIDEERKNKLESGDKLRVAVNMDPKNALFEAEMIYNGDRNNWTVLGQLNRLDMYGKQSWCVQHEIYRKYCICNADNPGP